MITALLRNIIRSHPAALACTLALLAAAPVYGQGFGGGARRTATSGNYPSSTSVGQASFMSDPETRKIIAVTDAETAKYISQIITNLDRPAPQVLIKVVFVEATYSKNLDLGIEGSYAKNIGGGQTSVVNQAFGLAAAGATPPGAGIYQILGSDFQATLRAIAQAGKAEILSRPSILARNNQQATISLGQQVPLISATRFDTLGGQINSVTYQNVGIILQVTPFITPDGMVEMIVSPQTSELADRSQWVPTSSNTAAPVINSRSADTVVVVPDGQTAVIGGLMSKLKQQADSKIPFLGDIPGLGALFKRRQKNDSRTELLIFLTPQIVRHPSDLATMATHERSNLQMQKGFSDGDLERFLDQLPAKGGEPKRGK
jgi:type II secretory pathway component GspD/PulD (secretin)